MLLVHRSRTRWDSLSAWSYRLIPRLRRGKKFTERARLRLSSSHAATFRRDAAGDLSGLDGVVRDFAHS